MVKKGEKEFIKSLKNSESINKEKSNMVSNLAKFYDKLQSERKKRYTKMDKAFHKFEEEFNY